MNNAKFLRAPILKNICERLQSWNKRHQSDVDLRRSGLFFWQKTEAVVRRFSVKKVFLIITQNSQENTFATVFAYTLKLYLKRDYGTSILLWILQNIQEHL